MTIGSTVASYAVATHHEPVEGQVSIVRWPASRPAVAPKVVDHPGGSGASAEKAGRILVVDDAAGTRLVVASALKREGFEVDQADGGEAALAMIDRHRPETWCCSTSTCRA